MDVGEAISTTGNMGGFARALLLKQLMGDEIHKNKVRYHAITMGRGIKRNADSYDFDPNIYTSESEKATGLGVFVKTEKEALDKDKKQMLADKIAVENSMKFLTQMHDKNPDDPAINLYADQLEKLFAKTGIKVPLSDIAALKQNYESQRRTQLLKTQKEYLKTPMDAEKYNNYETMYGMYSNLAKDMGLVNPYNTSVSKIQENRLSITQVEQKKRQEEEMKASIQKQKALDLERTKKTEALGGYKTKAEKVTDQVKEFVAEHGEEGLDNPKLPGWRKGYKALWENFKRQGTFTLGFEGTQPVENKKNDPLGWR